MASITIVFRKDKINKKGEVPIHFRIIKNRKPTYISSGYRLLPVQWDEKKNKVKSNYPNSARLNSLLSKRYTEIEATILEHESKSISLTSQGLRDKVFGKRPSHFFLFADEVVAKYKAEGKIGTYDKNKAIISKLRAYRPNISFYDITLEFLHRYENYLRGDKHKNKTNTINKDFKFIRKVFNDAIRQDVIEYEANPFRKFQIKSEKTQRTYITEEELKSFENCTLPAGVKLELHKDMFVFAAYAAGLRISDILQLQWEDFDGTHLNVVIRKTGAQIAIKVPNKGLLILNKYSLGKKNNASFIFPVLPPQLDQNNPEEVDCAISNATAYINKNLKTIAKAAGIEKNLSFHISRHSFAVRALKKGITIDKLSKLMGHSAIKETQVYAKVVNEELDKAMDAFN